MRRRAKRRRVRIALGVLAVLLVAGVIYELHQPFARITHVQVFGADQSLSEVALSAMRGSYLGIIPRDSTLLYPESAIRAQILAAHPEFAAVSLFRTGLTGLTIRVDARVPIARWCGLAPTPGVADYCYVFDASGVIYAAADASVETINPFALYAPLVGGALEPLQATIDHATILPATFDFARQVGALGSSVKKIVIHDGEVDDYLTSDTRVSYVLGSEQSAFTALSSAQSSFNLSDGSIDYVDLRFDGKVYLKRKQEQ